MKIVEFVINLVIAIVGLFLVFMMGWLLRGYKQNPSGIEPIDTLANNKTIAKIGDVMDKNIKQTCCRPVVAPVTAPVVETK